MHVEAEISRLGIVGAHEAAADDDAVDDDDEGGSRIALEADLPNLPNVLQRAGYRTGFVGKYHLEPEKYGRYPGKDGDVFGPEADAWLKERSTWLTGRIKQRGFDFVSAPIDFRTSQFKGIELYGMSYSQLMASLHARGITINRKMLADLAVRDLTAFGAIARPE